MRMSYGMVEGVLAGVERLAFDVEIFLVLLLLPVLPVLLVRFVPDVPAFLLLATVTFVVAGI